MSATPTAAAATEVGRVVCGVWECDLGGASVLLRLWLVGVRVGRLAHPDSSLVSGRYQGGPARVRDPGEGPFRER